MSHSDKYCLTFSTKKEALSFLDYAKDCHVLAELNGKIYRFSFGNDNEDFIYKKPYWGVTVYVQYVSRE